MVRNHPKAAAGEAKLMPIAGAMVFGEYVGKLNVIRVGCRKCSRAGQYTLASLIQRYGPDHKLTDWRLECVR